jgi:hypothetical protein
MRHISEYENFRGDQISENLNYHLENGISMLESVFRIESESWLSLLNEARARFHSGEINLTDDEIWLIGTDAGTKGIYEGAEVLLDVPFLEVIEINEAEYRGKKVKLNRPFRTPSGPRKFSVYTKNEKGNIVKVGFGEPGMRVNNANPEKARSFRKRMRCDNPGPKWKPRYWACNVGRYSKILGLVSSRSW